MFFLLRYHKLIKVSEKENIFVPNVKKKVKNTLKM